MLSLISVSHVLTDSFYKKKNLNSFLIKKNCYIIYIKLGLHAYHCSALWLIPTSRAEPKSKQQCDILICLQGACSRYWSDLFFYLHCFQCLSKAFLITNQNLCDIRRVMSKTQSWQLFHCYVNKVCALFLFTLVQYVGISSFASRFSL